MGHERTVIPLIGALVASFANGFKIVLEKPRTWWHESREKNRPLGIVDDSPNQRWMWICYQLAWAAVWGNDADWQATRAIALLELRLHLVDVGLWTSEQCTGRPHGGMYLDGWVALRIAARVRKDTELLAASEEWHRRFMGYALLTSTPALEVLCCGERMPGGPAAQQQSAWLREINGVPQRGELADDKATANIQDDAWVSLRGLRALLAVGDEHLVRCRSYSPEMVTFPLVARTIEVTRWPGWHLARYVVKPSKGLEGVCDWVVVNHAVVDGNRADDLHGLPGVTFGTNFERLPVLSSVPHDARVVRSDRRVAA